MKGKNCSREILCVLCLAVIVFSAWWSGKLKEKEAFQRAGLSKDQPLSHFQMEEEEKTLLRKNFHPPCQGKILCPFSPKKPVLHPDTQIWHPHLGLDFACFSQDQVFSMLDGTVIFAEKGKITVENRHFVCIYQGFSKVSVREGDSLFAGDPLGWGGGSVFLEGKNILCVQIQNKKGEPVDFSFLFSSGQA